jgi:hypothetical protein
VVVAVMALRSSVVDLLCGGPALLFVSNPFSFSFSSGLDILIFLRGGSGTSEDSLALSS